MQFEVKDLSAITVKRPALYQDVTNPNNIVFTYSFACGNIKYVFLTGPHTGQDVVDESHSFLKMYKYFDGELYLTN